MNRYGLDINKVTSICGVCDEEGELSLWRILSEVDGQFVNPCVDCVNAFRRNPEKYYFDSQTLTIFRQGKGSE